jgi:hypothetical protein
MKAVTPAERRKAKRRMILDTFSLSVVIPKKGDLRLPLLDLSELGLGFEVELEEDESALMSLRADEQMELHLYLNQSLFLPLKVTVKRLIPRGKRRQVGVEFVQQGGSSHSAVVAFLKMLDILSESQKK